MIVENIVTNLYVEFSEDWLQNGNVLGNRKYDNINNDPKNKSNVGSHWDSFLGPRSCYYSQCKAE